MSSNIPSASRLPVFAFALMFSAVVLGFDGYFIKLYSAYYYYYGYDNYPVPTWVILGVTASGLTIASLLPMLVIDIFRKGAVMSFVIVDLGLIGALWILWLVTSVYTTIEGLCAYDYIFYRDYDFDYYHCPALWVVIALAYFSASFLAVYWVTLLVFAIIAVARGQSRIWYTGVRDANFLASDDLHPPQLQPQQEQQPQIAGMAAGVGPYMFKH